jgi:cystathionine beta-synthase
MTAKDLVTSSKSQPLLTIEANETVANAIKLMQANDYSQIPVTKDKRIVGSISDSHIYNQMIKDPHVKLQTVESIMQPAFPFVDISTPIESLSKMITNENPAVLVKDFKVDKTFIITKHDIIKAMC